MGLTLPIGAVAWTGLSGPEIPAGTAVDTQSVDEAIFDVSAVEGGEAEDGKIGSREAYRRTLAGEEQSFSVLREAEPITEFIRATDFGESYVLGIETWTVPSVELKLVRLQRNGGQVAVTIEAQRTKRSGSDVGELKSLLVRVTNEDAAVPTEIDVEVRGE